MADFLFTWNPREFPYAELKKIVERFETGQPVVERWRCAAHRTIRVGDRAYLLKQGRGPRGIFGVGRVDGAPQESGAAPVGKKKRYVVPIRFEVLLDPTREMLVTRDDLLSVGVSVETLNHRASGFTFTPPAAARWIDEIAATEPPPTEEAQPAEERERRREMRLEAYRRDSKLVRELRSLYDGRCQICGAEPFNGQFGSLTEGHHIQWLCRGGPDSRHNLILLCPNHHAAMHEMDPEFDRAGLAFRFGSNTLPVSLDRHLKLA